jgi:hypothetical protein
LKVTKYNNNDPIPDSTNSTWGTAAIGALTEYIGVGVPAGEGMLELMDICTIGML